MIRSILTQLWNCRKANFSVLLELLLVFGLVWYITDFLFVYAFNLGIPNHRDMRHTWQVNIDLLQPDHPEYRAEENEPQALYDNYHRILRILQDYPGVEAVGMASNRAAPGSGNYRGRHVYSTDDTTRHVDVQEMDIYPGTDYFRVFRHTRDNGAGPVSVNDFDWTGVQRPVVVSRSVAEALFPGENAVGKQMVANPSATDMAVTIAGVVDDTKRFDYLRPRHVVYSAIQQMDSWGIQMWRFYAVTAIRSDASLPDSRFAEDFSEAMTGDLRAGNFFFNELVPYEKMAADTSDRFGVTSTLNIRVYLMAFFLLNILLCITGTFWYRVNVRRSEIGLRKAMGATNASVRSMFILEGLCLLSLAAPVAMCIELQFVGAGLIDTFGKNWGADTDKVYLIDRAALRFAITNGITWAILAAVILAAISIPARRAVALPSSEALRTN
ncbi:MAG: FtsX-like permease family protein [Tannerella sp.]|jgi:hypothetical protein|nr:FtsX-like permease family protein [Tannerella sp.]